MKTLMVGSMIGTFAVNCYLLYLIHFHLRHVLNSWAWCFIFTGFGCLFFISALFVQIMLHEEGEILHTIAGVLMFIKACLFAVGFTIFRRDLADALEAQAS